MPREEQLPPSTSANAVVGSSGTATVTLAPNGIEVWKLSTIAVRCSSNVSEPTAKVYLGNASDSNFIGGTYTGSLDSTDTTVVLQQAQPLVCVWTSADVGSTVTLSVAGTRILPG